MESKEALSSLAALAHEQRLEIFRLLIKAGETGVPAGEIATTLHVRPNTLSNNLSVLAAANLVHSKREGRTIRYFAALERMSALLGFLMEDCCGGNPEICRPVLKQMSCTN
ncbi:MULTISPECIES: ArsR/SmtB family transcription factor [Pseudovibrio]|uniref:ArsR/SmtB family transcription factor n=1 Tax=Stappiaceae TaxID=2821832 RepID=UPI002365D9C8|nr:MULTISPECIES: metalloregulator ArsR/SmtB family transcription factor [Pseudovibrio]MDD7911594.1 metalloregulator ArsR/SmtB family transcription factor [Pseudovibrio exalbescens]MDX5594330.1 metalloregulator ArsR/SmtB family transcription factor [Pseudovibrio sp. SPO723]